jgi:FkbM family methyltransferase
MLRGPFKSQTLGFLKARSVPIRTILDVGVFSETRELRLAFPKLKHVLFEPLEEFNPTIEQNYRGMDIEIHNCAVSRDTGDVKLQVWSIFSQWKISHSSMVGDEARGGDYRRVPKTSLDDFMSTRTYEEPFLLKVDIDGQELAVLEGARALLPRCSVLIVEATGPTLVERLAHLNAAGFQLVDLAEPCYYDGCFWQCDLVTVRDDVWRKCLGQTGQVTDPRKYTMFR